MLTDHPLRYPVPIFLELFGLGFGQGVPAASKINQTIPKLRRLYFRYILALLLFFELHFLLFGAATCYIECRLTSIIHFGVPMARPIKYDHLLTDEAGHASQFEFVNLANQLIADGRKPHVVFMSMLHAAYEASLARSYGEHYEFLMFAEADTADNLPLAKRMFDMHMESPAIKAILEELDIDGALAELEKSEQD